jgi:hypothetical protein
MLSSGDVKYIADNFGVYEHEWRAHAVMYGEPFLIDDCIVYFDGVVANIACFPFKNIYQEVTAKRISLIASALPDDKYLQGIYAWGQVAVMDKVKINKQDVNVIEQTKYSEFGERLLRIDDVNFDTNAKQRRYKNAVSNQGLSCQVKKVDNLTHEHQRIMAMWRDVHTMPEWLAVYAIGMPHFVSLENVYVLECYKGERLLGFSILSVPTPGKAVWLQNFVDRSVSYRVGDCIIIGLVETCKKLKVEIMHSGYAPDGGTLMKYKLKWGMNETLAPFREIFISNDSYIAGRMKKRGFMFPSRMIKPRPTGINYGGK